MNRIHATIIALFAATASAGNSAQAQVYLGNGVSFGLESMSNIATAPGNIVNLGTSSTAGLVTNQPLMLSLGANTTAEVTFSGIAGLYNGTVTNLAQAPSLPGGALATNYLMARTGGTVTMNFNAEQRYFSTIWGSVDSANSLSFYNNDTLIKTITGSMVASTYYGHTGLAGTSNVELRFSDLGYTRVVAASASSTFEFAPLSISTEAIDVAPIPLNAASIGGLLSFLMMIFLRGKGGTQIAIRMALASIMPRRRGMA